MNIHEYQAKALLREYGAPVSRGIPAFTPDEAAKAAEELGGPLWVVKSQIHAGGRGKGKFKELPADAKEDFKLGPEPTVKGAERTKTPYSPRRFLRGKEVFVLIDRTDPDRLAEFRALERQTKVRAVIARD